MSGSAITSRISGLASGLDTENIVKDLLSPSKAKIETVKQQKIILEWKQEYYKSIVSKLYDFQKKYFGTTSGGLNIAASLSRLNAVYSSPMFPLRPAPIPLKAAFISAIL